MYCLLRSEILIILDGQIIFRRPSCLSKKRLRLRNRVLYCNHVYLTMFCSWKIIAMRIFVNMAVLTLLALSAFAVIEVVGRSATEMESQNWWRQNEITIVMSLITYLFPYVFELLGFLESYHPRKQLRIQLAR